MINLFCVPGVVAFWRWYIRHNEHVITKGYCSTSLIIWQTWRVSSDSFLFEGRNIPMIIFEISSSVVTLAAWEDRKHKMAARHFSSCSTPITRNVDRNLDAVAVQLGPKFCSMLTKFSGRDCCRAKLLNQVSNCTGEMMQLELLEAYCLKRNGKQKKR